MWGYASVRRRDRRRMAKKIARERIEILFHLARKRAEAGDLDLARRYVDLILRIARKYNIRLGREKKYHICKRCHVFLIPGKTAQVRLKKGKVVVKCLECGNYKRYPYR